MLKLTPVKEFKDGSASYDYEYDKSFEEYYTRETGNKNPNKKEIGDFIVKMLIDIFGQEGKEKCKDIPFNGTVKPVKEKSSKKSTSLNKIRIDRRTPKK